MAETQSNATDLANTMTGNRILPGHDFKKSIAKNNAIQHNGDQNTQNTHYHFHFPAGARKPITDNVILVAREAKFLQSTEASRIPLQPHTSYLTGCRFDIFDAGVRDGKMTLTDQPTATLILDNEKNIYKYQEPFRAMFHIASLLRDTGFVKILLDKGCSEEKDQEGYTPLMSAAKKGHSDVVQMLLHLHSNVKAGNDNQWTALMFAAYYNKQNVISLLLRHNGEKTHIDAKNIDGSTALMHAASQGHVAVVEALLAADADVECRSDTGHRPLMLGAKNGHVTVVEVLLRHNAALEATNNHQSTALLLAVLGEHIEMVKMLLENGANKDARDSEGRDAIEIAIACPPLQTLLKTWTTGQSQEISTAHICPTGLVTA